MSNTSKLSNPFSTGGGGSHFEAHVQAAFLTLMLTGGHAPCLPCWPIAEIKLQGKIDGYDTDDLIVTVENQGNGEKRRLLGQVKHSIRVTKGDKQFKEVMQAAWSDFNNEELFSKGRDVIALITGPLSATDENNVQWLLNQARHTNDVEMFMRNVTQGNFSPPHSNEKLQVIQCHLKNANNGNDVSPKDMYAFLRHFYLIGYDLGNEFGVVLSLLHSHISQFHDADSHLVWSRMVDYVQSCNQAAGIITHKNIPDNIRELFKPKTFRKIPREIRIGEGRFEANWTTDPSVSSLALTILIGSWRDEIHCDQAVVTELLDITYKQWLDKGREIIQYSDSPLSLKNGIWRISDRVSLWEFLGTWILDHNLETFRELSLTVFKESNPAFELPAEDRLMAGIYSKTPQYSSELQNGISEGLAILGSFPGALSNCMQGKAEGVCRSVLRTLLTEADWVRWGSLNDLLPALAEACPSEFINLVEKALGQTNCPFDELFSQEGAGIFGENYLTGLLWALESLAWDEQYLIRVCVALGDLASHDPGGQWANRPLNSLVCILLPWLPQTLAPEEKRLIAVQTVCSECPDIAWDLLIQLFPNQHQTSSGSHKPRWRKIIPEGWKESISNQAYWSQTRSYVNLAIDFAGEDIERLSVLVDHFAKIPEDAADRLLKTLSTSTVLELAESQRYLIWRSLMNLINKHRKYSDKDWALTPARVDQIEQTADKIAPTNPSVLHRLLFDNQDHDLFDKVGNWEDQRKRLQASRDAAIAEIHQRGGIGEVVHFAESVSLSSKAGYALGAINDPAVDSALFPSFLSSRQGPQKDLISNYTYRQYQLNNDQWCDSLTVSGWTPEQIGIFASYLPFTQEVWGHVSDWLQNSEGQYWTRVNPNPYQAEENLAYAIEKFVEYGRPYAAIDCLSVMLYDKQPIDSGQCIQTLLAAVSSTESHHSADRYDIVEIIKYLQMEPSTNPKELVKVEWAYLSLLSEGGGATPRSLEEALANDPEFFCSILQLAYRPKGEDRTPKGSPKKIKCRSRKRLALARQLENTSRNTRGGNV